MTKPKPLPEIMNIPGLKGKYSVRCDCCWQYWVSVTAVSAHADFEFVGPTRHTKRGAINAWNKMVYQIRGACLRGY